MLSGRAGLREECDTMDPVADFHARARSAVKELQASGDLASGLRLDRIVVQTPRRGGPDRGDLVVDITATDPGLRHEKRQGVALALASRFGRDPDVASIEVAAGLINLTLQPRYLGSVLASALVTGVDWGRGAGKAPALVAVAGSAPGFAEPRPQRVLVVAEAIAELLAFTGHPVRLNHEQRVADGSATIVVRQEPDPSRSDSEFRQSCIVAVKPCHVREVGAAEIRSEPRVGDALRFAMLCHRSDLAITLDIDAVTDRSFAAPLFDVAYAHARVRRMLRCAEEGRPDLDLSPGVLAGADFKLLADSGERTILNLVLRFPHVAALAANRCEPHRLALLLRDLADAVHRQWNRSKDQPQLRFVNEEQRDMTEARLGLMTASALVLTSGLGIFGIKAPDEMC
jgi:arginyl-tRNA synthetase